MILNPTAVLNELIKYEKIVGFSKLAQERLSKGQPIDDLRDILKIRLDECGFTQAVGSTAATTPLHSVTSYLDKPDVLGQQIAEAQGFIDSIIEKIKADVGPFYSKKEVLDLKEVGDMTLNDQVWGPTMEPIKVKHYIDPSTGIVTQADWSHGQYRTAKDGQAFGPWKFFTK